MSSRLLLFLAALATLTPLTPSHAETRRIAVLVGNNAGGGERPPLRFAESDAGKMARVMVELGDVAPDDLFLLQGKGLTQLQDALKLVTRRVASLRAEPSTRVVLLFYFSGHSDGVALELGRERLTYTALREWLDKTGAEVKLAIVDSCKSGALLRAKGGSPGPAFQIKLTDDLSSSGQALITSSAEDELALESREIGGSFFTHHLVSGLRGAADASGDGQVTLTEAYQYAFSCTVTATSNTFTGGQHPAYDYRLSGQGELVLTQVHSPSAALELPEGFERVLLIQLLRDQVLAELPAGTPRKVALPPGEYAVKVWRDGRMHGARVRVVEGQVRSLRWEDLGVEGGRPVKAKGEGGEEQSPPAPPAPVVAQVAPARAPMSTPVKPPVGAPRPQPGPGKSWLSLAGGVRGTVATTLPVMPVLHLSIQQGHPGHGLAMGVSLGSSEAKGLRESMGQFSMGYRWAIVAKEYAAWFGVETLAQFTHQSLEGQREPLGWALNPGLGPWAGVSWGLTERVRLMFEAHAPFVPLQRDGKWSPLFMPGGRMGLQFVVP